MPGLGRARPALAAPLKIRTAGRSPPRTQGGQDWTFRDVSTQKHTHGIHLYPARMHPEIARRVIAKYSRPGDVVFDPFMGSGGVLLESILHGNNAAGLDINPLAVLISKVKTTVFKDSKISLITKALEAIMESGNQKIKAGGGVAEWAARLARRRQPASDQLQCPRLV